MARKVILQCLIGSHNYNLNTEDSDKDYKAFVLPTFDDLYYKNTYAKQTITTDRDIDVHDIRQLPELFSKQNINFLEILFSNEITMDSQFPEIAEIFALRDKIVTLSPSRMFSAVHGMYFTKLRLTERGYGTEGTQHLVDKYGYDTKQAMHTWRCLDFLMRFALLDFKDYKRAIVYTEGERDTMLAIKDGFYKTIEEFKAAVTAKETSVLAIRSIYDDQPKDEETLAQLEALIYEIVHRHITGQDTPETFPCPPELSLFLTSPLGTPKEKES